MKKYITFNDFIDSFSETYKNNFTYEGKRALFDYIEDLEESIGEEIELDTIALCCSYSEYDSALECAKEYGFDEMEEEQAREWLEERTTVIDVENGGVIIEQF